MAETAPPIDPGLLDLDPDVLWVMHCADGPVPKAAARAVEDFLERETRPWTLRFQQDFIDLPQATREEAARLLGARVDDVSLTATTSSGLAAVAQGFPWRTGDEVVLPLGEFPTNVWVWKALAERGVTVREVPLWEGHRAGKEAWESAPPTADAEPEARLLDALGPRTRLLAVSWVRFQDGLRLDLGRLAAGCVDRGVVLVVDAIQGAGTEPIDLVGIGAATAGGHKGLLAPQGLGFLWTSPMLRSRLLPSGTWLSVEDATDFDRPSTDFDRAWLDDGRRLEPGVPNLIGAAALHQSLKVLNRAGPAAIAGHIAGLRTGLIDGLAEIPRWHYEARRLAELDRCGRLASIVSLHHGGEGAEGLDQLLRRGFEDDIYASVREGYFRVALHGWHSAADVRRILDWLRQDGR